MRLQNRHLPILVISVGFKMFHCLSNLPVHSELSNLEFLQFKNNHKKGYYVRTSALKTQCLTRLECH